MAFSNTTNLINHLIRKHSDDLVDDAMGGKIALKAIFKKDAGGFNKPAPVAEAVKLTKLPDDVKRDYDAAAVKWIVKSCMPHNITERDQYLREFLKLLTHGRYSGPMASTVNNMILEMSVKYLKLPQVNPINDDGTDFDLLAWWKAGQTIFPHLSKMARQFHAFPATSAGVEHLFSAAGRMHNDFKKSTSETTLEHALIVYKNLD
eukprot:jgi/Tetstr1/444489/TSEL_032370.t1